MKIEIFLVFSQEGTRNILYATLMMLNEIVVANELVHIKFVLGSSVNELNSLNLLNGQ